MSPPHALHLESAAARSMAAKCGRTIMPRPDNRLCLPLLSTNRPPNSASKFLTAMVSDGCDTPQRLAARIKFRSSQKERK